MAATRSSPPSLPSRIRERNRPRSWWIRAPLLAWFALTFRAFLEDPAHGSLWSGINLVFHEIGHILFAPFPDLVTAAGGTLMELAIPVVAGLLLIRQRDDFGGALALFWLGTALAGAAPYAGDARAQLLPLVSPFPGPASHDWSYILGTLGLLEHDTSLSRALRTAGLGTMAAGIFAGGWVVTLMATDGERPRRGGRVLERVLAGKSGSLAREDAQFRAWWAAREEAGGVPAAPDPAAEGARVAEPAPEAAARAPDRHDPPVRDAAAEWLDRKELEGRLSAEEERFREWLRGQD